MKAEPFGLAGLLEALRGALRAEGAGAVGIAMLPGAPERVNGDLERLRQIFVHLTLYVLEGRDPATAQLNFGHDGAILTGEIASTPRAIRSAGSSICSWA